MRKARRLLMTGAAGTIGRMIRPGLADLAETVVLSDIDDLGEAAPHERIEPCDLTDTDGLRQLVEGCDAILHFGGISGENTAELIHRVNIDALYQLYEAARKAGTARILFPSSNHTIGFYPRETRLTASVPVRPDTLYGVSKVYGEGLARLYWEKHGLETLIARIGSCFPEPRDRRMMATWLSAGDLLRLIARMIDVPRLGCPIVYAASRNAESWWDNGETAYLGWHPQDSTEPWEGRFDAPPGDPEAPEIRYQGGSFAASGHFED